MLTNMDLSGTTFAAGGECKGRRHGPAVYIGSGEHKGIWVYCESIELVEVRDQFLEHYL